MRRRPRGRLRRTRGRGRGRAAVPGILRSQLPSEWRSSQPALRRDPPLRRRRPTQDRRRRERRPVPPDGEGDGSRGCAPPTGFRRSYGRGQRGGLRGAAEPLAGARDRSACRRGGRLAPPDPRRRDATPSPNGRRRVRPAPDHPRRPELAQALCEKPPDRAYPVDSEGGARADLPVDLVHERWRNTRGFTDVFGRLVWHRPSITIRTEFFRPEKGRFLHPTADRPITVREAARLQSFPDEFVLPESQR